VRGLGLLPSPLARKEPTRLSHQPTESPHPSEAKGGTLGSSDEGSGRAMAKLFWKRKPGLFHNPRKGRCGPTWRKTMKSAKVSVSGLIAVATIMLMTTFEAHSYDFLGADIGPGIVVPNADGCAAACNGNASCQAWTFVTAGHKGPAAFCFLKNQVPAPTFDAACPDNIACVSGLKRSDGWCGESPGAPVQGSQSILGQGQVLSCPSGKSCQAKVTGGQPQVCWFLGFIPYPCHAPRIQTTDWFCQ
jgi:hypothetical protein